ncbi:MAG: hypothetical protein RLZZ480_189 [Candidatus Parcubacteria bacterium]|jgi:YD repeat-containing protein
MNSPYLETYTYNALGNLLTKSNIGSYTYAGTSYANPHAPTTINGVSYSYDNNGNLTTVGADTYTWDYQNRLLESIEAGDTITYQYDHSGSRVSKDNGTSTTLYPSRYYEVVGGTPTKYLYTGDVLIGTIEGAGASSTLSFSHPDHLGSTNVTTDSATYPVEESWNTRMKFVPGTFMAQ